MSVGATSVEVLDALRADEELTGSRHPRPEMSVASPKKQVGKIISTVILIGVGLSFLLPIAWIVLASIDDAPSLAVKIPKGVTFDHFGKVLNWETTFRPLLISLLISGGAALIIVTCSLLAAYPLSRYNLRWGKGFMYTVLFGTTLPITAMMVPVYALFVSMNLINNILGVILFMSAGGLPMAIWMLKNFMDSVPMEVEEAAWIDGASPMKTLWSIVVPLMRPGIAVVFVFQFTGAWGNFFVPFVLLFNPDLQPASSAIYGFFGNYGLVQYGQLAAFAILYSLPAIVLYVVSQKLAGSEFSLAGGVKG